MKLLVLISQMNKENNGSIIATPVGHVQNESSHAAKEIVSHRGLLFTSLVSGACAGAVAKTVIAPLDRTKIIFQVSETRFSYRKAMDILYKGYKKYGVMNWWRGNSATMARIMPYASLQFTAHEQIKLFFKTRNENFLPKTKRFVGGSLAGVFASSCTYPLDMVRARMAIAGKKKYTNLRNAFISIYRQEGFRTFYNGFIPTIMGIMPYAGISFFVYESLKKQFHDNHPNENISTLQRLLFGGFAGACGQSFSYPLDIIRRRQQTDGLDGKGYRYRSLLWTINYIVKTEGIRKGLFKGLSINFIKGPIAVGVSFATYDTVRIIINVYIEKPEVQMG